jgi:hypothetical protein
LDYPNNLEEIVDSFKISGENEEYTVIQVDTDKLNGNVKWFYDSNVMTDNPAIYTNEPLPANSLKIITKKFGF